MKTRLSLIALAVSFSALGAAAQAAPAAHDWIPAGEGASDDMKAPPATSTTSREAVKEQALEARRNGTLSPAGDIGADRRARAEIAAPSTQSRDDVRAQTLAAVREGTIAPFGETAGAD